MVCFVSVDQNVAEIMNSILRLINSHMLLYPVEYSEVRAWETEKKNPVRM